MVRAPRHLHHRHVIRTMAAAVAATAASLLTLLLLTSTLSSSYSVAAVSSAQHQYQRHFHRQPQPQPQQQQLHQVSRALLRAAADDAEEGSLERGGDQHEHGHGRNHTHHHEEEEEECEESTDFSCIDQQQHVGTIILLFSALAASAVLIEKAIHLIEHVIATHKSSFAKNVLAAVLEETMILGLISFLLFVVTTQRSLDELTKIIFEFVHYLLFVGMLNYIALVCFFSVAMTRRSHAWKRYEELSLVMTRHAMGATAARQSDGDVGKNVLETVTSRVTGQFSGSNTAASIDSSSKGKKNDDDGGYAPPTMQPVTQSSSTSSSLPSPSPPPPPSPLPPPPVPLTATDKIAHYHSGSDVDDRHILADSVESNFSLSSGDVVTKTTRRVLGATSTVLAGTFSRVAFYRDYKTFRDLFVLSHELDPEFPFHVYLRKTMCRAFIKSIHITWRHWLSFIVLFSFILVVTHYEGGITRHGEISGAKERARNYYFFLWLRMFAITLCTLMYCVYIYLLFLTRRLARYNRRVMRGVMVMNGGNVGGGGNSGDGDHPGAPTLKVKDSADDSGIDGRHLQGSASTSKIELAAEVAAVAAAAEEVQALQSSGSTSNMHGRGDGNHHHSSSDLLSAAATRRAKRRQTQQQRRGFATLARLQRELKHTVHAQSGCEKCMPCCYEKHPYMSLFAFKSPNFPFRFFQLCLLFQAVYAAYLFLVYFHMDVSVFEHLSMLVPLCLVVLVMPSFLQRWALTRYTGLLADKKLMSMVRDRHQTQLRARRAKAAAATTAAAMADAKSKGANADRGGGGVLDNHDDDVGMYNDDDFRKSKDDDHDDDLNRHHDEDDDDDDDDDAQSNFEQLLECGSRRHSGGRKLSAASASSFGARGSASTTGSHGGGFGPIKTFPSENGGDGGDDMMMDDHDDVGSAMECDRALTAALLRQQLQQK